MLFGLIFSALVATGLLVMFASKRKPTAAKNRNMQRIEFEEALIDFTPKKGYLPIFERNNRLK